MPCSHPVRMKFRRCSTWTFRRNVIAPWSNTSHSHSRFEKRWRSHPADWNFRLISTFACTFTRHFMMSRALPITIRYLIKLNCLITINKAADFYTLSISGLWYLLRCIAYIEYCVPYVSNSPLVFGTKGVISRKLQLLTFPANIFRKWRYK